MSITTVIAGKIQEPAEPPERRHRSAYPAWRGAHAECAGQVRSLRITVIAGRAVVIDRGAPTHVLTDQQTQALVDLIDGMTGEGAS